MNQKILALITEMLDEMPKESSVEITLNFSRNYTDELDIVPRVIINTTEREDTVTTTGIPSQILTQTLLQMLYHAITRKASWHRGYQKPTNTDSDERE